MGPERSQASVSLGHAQSRGGTLATTMKALHFVRVGLLVVAAAAALASAGSQDNKPAVGAYDTTAAPQPQAMDPALAMGLWKSSFGAVKVEADTAKGQGAVQGVWVYDRGGQEVIGYFSGPLSGNVLQFTWQEPAADGSSLLGAGYVVFDPYGQRFTGKWWTDARDRQGEWTGWRQAPAATPPNDPPPDDDYQPPPTNY
jgi:hypothetical protein